MKVEVKDWFGLLELYFIVETWRPGYRRFNEKFHWNGAAVFIVDREWWERIP